jgi:LacI family transcriptional regulator
MVACKVNVDVNVYFTIIITKVMARITLKDIAKETGYSIKTVSRALNDHIDISDKTKELILNVASKYSYQPNLLARSLRQRRAHIIGYVIPDITNEFFGDVALAIEDEFKKQGYCILTSFTDSIPEQEIESLKLLISRQVDGVILATVGTTGQFIQKMIENYKVPLVVIDNEVKGLRTNLVIHDNIRGAYLLTKHLIDHGHKTIACISGPLEEPAGEKRLDGYKKALKESGLRFSNNLVIISDWKIEGGYEATIELFQIKHDKFTAIFIANSVMALGCVKALRELKVKVPDEVAIVSFDHLRFTEALNPPLTTLQSIESEIGKRAAEMLLRKIEDNDPVNIEEVLVGSELCIRESCGCKI